MDRIPRVVIIGGGFGGLAAARSLRGAPVHVTLIDRRNFHLFQPLLYQVATGSLSPGEIAAPLRGILSRQKNARVLLGDVIDVNPQDKCVLLADGANVEYDSLIVAAGSQSSYYGHDAWRAWAPSLKSVEEAIEIRHKILHKGNLAVIGRAAAMPNVFGVYLSGMPAWLVWAFIHLMYIVEFQSRIVVFIPWAFQDLTFSRAAQLITGTSTTDFNFNKEIVSQRSSSLSIAEQVTSKAL
jgi:NADH dehydrogenase FAD-containing subunit